MFPLLELATIYRIDTLMIKSLNYSDFQLLIINRLIASKEQELNRKVKDINAKRGVNVQPATNDDLTRMFG